jgi:hypothetical protein
MTKSIEQFKQKSNVNFIKNEPLDFHFFSKSKYKYNTFTYAVYDFNSQMKNLWINITLLPNDLYYLIISFFFVLMSI